MKKSTGIVRRVDDLGRIVLPKELRTTLCINEGNPIEIFVADDEIILKKYQPGCVLCGGLEDLTQIKDKPVCKNCAHSLVDAFKEADQKTAVVSKGK